jgi:hypothetical protein
LSGRCHIVASSSISRGEANLNHQLRCQPRHTSLRRHWGYSQCTVSTVDSTTRTASNDTATQSEVDGLRDTCEYSRRRRW